MKRANNFTITVLRKPDEAQGAKRQLSRDLGFRPAFFDCATARIYLSRYRDGRVAPFHLLDGLPDEVVLVRAECGHVVATKSTLISGFERHGFFYTRSATARAIAEWSFPLPV